MRIIDDLSFYFNNREIGVLLRRLDGHVLYANKSYQNLTNTSHLETLVGENISHYIGEKALIRTNEKLTAENNYSANESTFMNEGSDNEIFASVTALKLFEGEQEYVLIFLNRTVEIEDDANDYRDRFAKNLKYYRKQMNLSQSILAKSVDVSERQIQRMESGKSNPSLDSVIKLSSVFKVTIDHMFKEI